MSLTYFTNPATNAVYTWERNPASENVAVKLRNIERLSNTGNVGATKQQGEDGAYILDWTIDVLTTSFETNLWEWYMLSKTQTIYLTDWDGETYEGQIISLQRQRLLQPIPHRLDYMSYDFQFEVYRFVSGMFHTAGVDA